MKKSSTIPRGITKLNVFLAKNRDKEKSDFRVIIYGKVNGRAVFISGNLLPTSKSVFPIVSVVLFCDNVKGIRILEKGTKNTVANKKLFITL